MRIVAILLWLYICFSCGGSTRRATTAAAVRGGGGQHEENRDRQRHLANDLPWNGPSTAISIGLAGLSQTLPPIATSGASTVVISVNLSAGGILEASGGSVDTLQLYYQVDTNPEVLWKDIKGSNFLAQESVVVPAPGNLLTLRVNGKTSHSSETYYLSNFQVVDPNTGPMPPPSPVADAPVPSPMVAPLPSPVVAAAPVPSPIAAPVSSPVAAAPVPTLPTVPAVCSVPKLTGSWVNPHSDFPIAVVESHGALIGKDFCIVSGFFDGINSATPNIYCLDTQDTSADWVQRVSLKDSDSIEGTKLGDGISHGAETVIGSRFYMCGGFLGGNPGQAIKDCWYYDHTSNTINAITSIPAPRGGGALMYSPQQNMLIATAGAVRPIVGKSKSIDQFNTWTYDLAQGDNGVWVSQDDIPFSANHIMYVRAYDDTGMERFYVMGGQQGEDERYGNTELVYEFVPSKPKGTNQQWIQRASMALKRGHSSSSTRAYGCGFIMVAGTTNQPTGKIDRIDYYDIPSDTWTQIGNLGNRVNTAICVIYKDPSGQDWVWCTSPYGLYKKQKISL